jgi:glucose-1-phosphate thymidylyltransferase
MEIIGLIPAGGKAKRLGKIPCSKEILPVYKSKLNVNSKFKINVISEYLINSYRIAGINNIYFILRRGKWDIPEYFGDGTDFGVNISYLMMDLPYGTPFTMDQAYPFTRGKYIALGFPDIIFSPANAFIKVKEKISETNADLVLGVFKIKNYKKSDMVEFDDRGKIRNIIIKQNRPDLKYGWTIALWNTKFWDFMHEYIQDVITNKSTEDLRTEGSLSRELYPGDIFLEAIKNGMNAEAVIFENGKSIDIGTPEDFKEIFPDN